MTTYCKKNHFIQKLEVKDSQSSKNNDLYPKTVPSGDIGTDSVVPNQPYQEQCNTHFCEDACQLKLNLEEEDKKETSALSHQEELHDISVSCQINKPPWKETDYMNRDQSATAIPQKYLTADNGAVTSNKERNFNNLWPPMGVPRISMNQADYIASDRNDTLDFLTIAKQAGIVPREFPISKNIPLGTRKEYPNLRSILKTDEVDNPQTSHNVRFASPIMSIKLFLDTPDDEESTASTDLLFSDEEDAVEHEVHDQKVPSYEQEVPTGEDIREPVAKRLKMEPSSYTCIDKPLFRFPPPIDIPNLMIPIRGRSFVNDKIVEEKSGDSPLTIKKTSEDEDVCERLKETAATGMKLQIQEENHELPLKNDQEEFGSKVADKVDPMIQHDQEEFGSKAADKVKPMIQHEQEEFGSKVADKVKPMIQHEQEEFGSKVADKVDPMIQHEQEEIGSKVADKVKPMIQHEQEEFGSKVADKVESMIQHKQEKFGSKAADKVESMTHGNKGEAGCMMTDKIEPVINHEQEYTEVRSDIQECLEAKENLPSDECLAGLGLRRNLCSGFFSPDLEDASTSITLDYSVEQGFSSRRCGNDYYAQGDKVCSLNLEQVIADEVEIAMTDTGLASDCCQIVPGSGKIGIKRNIEDVGISGELCQSVSRFVEESFIEEIACDNFEVPTGVEVVIPLPNDVGIYHPVQVEAPDFKRVIHREKTENISLSPAGEDTYTDLDERFSLDEQSDDNGSTCSQISDIAEQLVSATSLKESSPPKALLDEQIIRSKNEVPNSSKTSETSSLSKMKPKRASTVLCELQSSLDELNGPELLEVALQLVEGALKKTKGLTPKEDSKPIYSDKRTPGSSTFMRKHRFPYESQHASLNSDGDNSSHEAKGLREEDVVQVSCATGTRTRHLRIGLSRKSRVHSLHPYAVKPNNIKKPHVTNEPFQE
ncbi:uncharacterized protein LOC116618642 isoform X2 [Nematostella vectensis]|uniref:uncharacterized protein LOC116618642 isoform X2 n=1 Tax=Nematostella vectensis TaxID=45351 RepID=UPI00138FCFE1|nr:uncharacterized protein LOC116618642 isoform X2 [Nematostella vectensis]